MQQSIVKFVALSYRHCSTCFGHYNAHHQEPVKLPLQPLISIWMWRWKCWAVSVWQSNKFYDWLMHLVGCFIWVCNNSFTICTSSDPLSKELDYHHHHRRQWQDKKDVCWNPFTSVWETPKTKIRPLQHQMGRRSLNTQKCLEITVFSNNW